MYSDPIEKISNYWDKLSFNQKLTQAIAIISLIVVIISIINFNNISKITNNLSNKAITISQESINISKKALEESKEANKISREILELQNKTHILNAGRQSVEIYNLILNKCDSPNPAIKSKLEKLEKSVASQNINEIIENIKIEDNFCVADIVEHEEEFVAEERRIAMKVSREVVAGMVIAIIVAIVVMLVGLHYFTRKDNNN